MVDPIISGKLFWEAIWSLILYFAAMLSFAERLLPPSVRRNRHHAVIAKRRAALTRSVNDNIVGMKADDDVATAKKARILIQGLIERTPADPKFGTTPSVVVKLKSVDGHPAVVLYSRSKGYERQLQDTINATEGMKSFGLKLLTSRELEYEKGKVEDLEASGAEAARGYPADVDAQSSSGEILLLHAAASGHKSDVQQLLEEGTDIEVKDRWGRTPLSCAATNGHGAIVKLLLEKKANIEARDNSGQTPLSCAAENGRLAVVKLLLEWDANIEGRDISGQMPPSSVAERSADIEAKDRWGRTPLSCAATNGHGAIVKLLLEKKANIKTRDNSGQTPLSRAAEDGRVAIVKLLLEWGADIEAMDYSGQTPLSHAETNRHYAVVKLLQNGTES